MLNITCPEGAASGSTVQVAHPTTQAPLAVTVPPGISPGMTFQVQIPDEMLVGKAVAVAAPVPPVMAQPAVAAPVQPVMAQPVVGQPVAAMPGVAMPGAAPGMTTVVVHQSPAATVVAEEPYCGLVSVLICLFIPCGCFICLCPVDKRTVTVQG